MTTVIELSPGVSPGDVLASLESTTVKIKQKTPYRPELISLGNIAPVCADDEWVKSRGSSLRKVFAAGGAIASALSGAMLAPGVHSIYLRTLADEVEMLDWEMLYDEDGGLFLSLNSTWPIGRLTSPQNAGRPPQPFPPSLRFMAVLSAAGQDGSLDWKHLNAEIQRARAANLPVEFLVFTGQPEIEEAVTSAGGQLRPLPEKPDELVRAVRDFNPHVLHFFCHGSPNQGAPFLELATSNDFLEGSGHGSLILPVDYLRDALVSSAIWLLVLNSCSGAESGGPPGEADSRSLARKLAEEAEVPAAIGMAAPISPALAAEFTRSFYPTFFECARKILCEDGFNPIDWATLLVPARKALSLGIDPADQREWSLPVVYALAPSFSPAFVQRPLTAVLPASPLPSPGPGGRTMAPEPNPAPPEPAFALRPAHLAVLQFAAQAMRTLTLPPAVKRQALEEMLKEIPQSFWPDINGDFPVSGGS